MVASYHAIVAAGILPSLSVHALPSRRAEPDTDSIEWGPCDIPLSDDLQQLAAENNECALFSVPLDYTNKESSSTIDLHLVKLPASEGPSKGSVLTNPGGPGSSGVQFIVGRGTEYTAPIHKHYDIIGFDPRGVGRTIPFDCKHNASQNDSTEPQRRSEVFSRNMTELAEESFADSIDLAEDCFRNQNETGRFMTTAFAARDMLSIVDALGEDGMLRYWGISYGTFLGMTFASMFPDRVDRMLLDAVHDPQEHVAGRWLDTPKDAEIALNGFFEQCVQNASLCTLAEVEEDTTAESLLDEFNNVLAALAKEDFTTARYSQFKQTVFEWLYNPNNFLRLSALIKGAFQGSYALLEDAVAEADPSLDTYNQGINAWEGTVCSDSTFRASSIDDVLEMAGVQQTVGGFSDAVSPRLWGCANWKFEPAERFTGPFEGKTANPILFANGIYDPGTPMEVAVNMSRAYEGAGLLVHKGNGHGVMNHPSNCTADAISAYFLDGALPPADLECEPNLPPFEYAESLKEAAEAAAAAATNETSSG